MPPATSLKELPDDVLRIVAESLAMPELRGLRSTCRRLEHETFVVFVRRGYARENLTIDGLNGQTLEGLMHVLNGSPQLVSSLETLQTLSIRHVTSTYWVIVNVIKSLGSNLVKLHLHEVTSTDGVWCSTFKVIRSLKLQRLEFSDLKGLGWTMRGGWDPSAVVDLFGDGNNTVHISVRGEHGMEHLRLHDTSASMVGRMVMESGLEMVIGRFAKLQRRAGWEVAMNNKDLSVRTLVLIIVHQGAIITARLWTHHSMSWPSWPSWSWPPQTVASSSSSSP